MIDIDKLRADLKDYYMGAYFGGGFKIAIIDISAIEKAAPNELIQIAQKQNIDLSKYIVAD